jgi:hypothetical protein
MRLSCLIPAMALFAAVIGCSPMVVPIAKASEFKISGECEKRENGTFVKIRIVSTDGSSNWKVDFDGARPEEFSVNTYVAVTDVQWKLGQSHIKPLGIAPYEIRLSSGEKVFKATISFKTTSEQILGAVIASVIRIH